MARRRLHFTFGNHMHWADMEWLWGYDVLPGCVQDMLELIDGTGVRGGVNFDAVGYERMAAECPEALESLKRAVADGRVEVVGGSYGQPYGHFHGGESNVRQLVYGVRAVQRQLGVRPRTFWEEEFWFHPQLPQMLRQCGFTGACLFFQWTWHTPELPLEEHALVLWEGCDGTRLPALPRNALNVHQWPEDFDGLLEGKALQEIRSPAVVQWVELMPSRDWMCRSELLLPRLQELLEDPRFQVCPGTPGELLKRIREEVPDPPVRAYSMDDVWHGMSLGKNDDRHPRRSGRVEARLLAAESLATSAGLLGRPYASWDVYPIWELEEGWRELLAAQHHDNHECEDLCGRIGWRSLERAEGLAGEVLRRTRRLVGGRVSVPAGGLAVFNPLGWARGGHVQAPSGETVQVGAVPPFGWRAFGPQELEGPAPCALRERDGLQGLEGPAGSLWVDGRTGLVEQVTCEQAGGSLLAAPLLRLEAGLGGRRETFESGAEVHVAASEAGGPMLAVDRRGRDGSLLQARLSHAPDTPAWDLEVVLAGLPELDPGFGGALKLHLQPRPGCKRLLADAPGFVGPVAPSGTRPRKYPGGDWMTSEQWFEEVESPFTALQMVDLVDSSGCGLLVLHGGTQQWLRTAEGVAAVLTLRDPWDAEPLVEDNGRVLRMRLVPHGPVTHGERLRLAQEHRRPLILLGSGGVSPDAPAVLSGPQVDGAPNVLATAWYRESSRSGRGLPAWAGHRLEADSQGAATHPQMLRLVEVEGRPAHFTVLLPGAVGGAARTDLMGEVGPEGWLSVQEVPAPEGRGGSWSAVELELGPHEIATLVVDLLAARKQWRDLDARREVWAAAHRRSAGS